MEKLDVMALEAPGDYVTDIGNCARCRGDHEKVVFQSFLNPPPTYSRWASCPTTGEPILLLVTPVVTPDDQDNN